MDGLIRIGNEIDDRTMNTNTELYRQRNVIEKGISEV